MDQWVPASVATPTTIRPATEDEQTYVRCTWLATALHRRRQTNGERQRIRQLVDALLGESILVAVRPSPTRAEEVVGWLCYSPMRTTAVCHFVYVRDKVRREGVARALLTAAGVDLARTVLATSASDMLPAVLAASGLRVEQMRAEDVL